VIFSGLFDGFPPISVISNGGEVGVTSFTRLDAGHYRIEFDLSASQRTAVSIFATGFGASVDGTSAVLLMGVNQAPADIVGLNLFIDVTAIMAMVFEEFDPVFVQVDTTFSVLVVDNR
jgi:hypothetical protein